MCTIALCLKNSIHTLINDAVGKIVPTELLDTSLSQTFDLLKNTVSAKCNMTRCICNGKQDETLLPCQLTVRAIPMMCWWCSLAGCCSVTKSCPSLCDPMDCSTPGFPVLHYLLEFAQIHAHCVGGAIQPSHPLSPPSPPALSLSQHQGLFQWVISSHHVAKLLEL